MIAKKQHSQKLLFVGRGAGNACDLGTLSGLFLVQQPDEFAKITPVRQKVQKPSAKQIFNAKELAKKLVGDFARESLVVATATKWNQKAFNGSGRFDLVY